MAARVVDPAAFISAGAVIDWAEGPGTHHAKLAHEVADERGLDTVRILQLRWAFDATLGYPVSPFVVWARPHSAPQTKVPFTRSGPVVSLSGSWHSVSIEITSGPGGVAMAWSGMPFAGTLLAHRPVAAGATVVTLSGPSIRAVLLPVGTQVGAIHSFTDVASDPAWTEVEVVGLPGDGSTAANTDLTAPQGLVTGLTSPDQAALDRFRRGAPLTGWPATLPTGQAVPPWQLADPVAMLKVFWAAMLPDFIDMVDTAAVSSDQHLKSYQRDLAVPSGQTAEATFNPLKLVLYGGVSDPLASLILGLGTAYPLSRRSHAGLVDFAGWGSTIGVDFMVTGVFRRPTGGLVERATFVFAPGPAGMPPTPAAMAADVQGVQPPVDLDDPYRSVVTVDWDAPPAELGFFVGSHAFARWSSQPASGVEMLLDPRPMDTALHPRGASRNADRPQRRALSDTEWPISSAATPNRLRYAVASQDVFGLWSAWNQVPVDVQEPPVSPVSLTGARLDTTPAAGPCPATLTVDLTWNWTSRSPQTITVVGRRYPQTWPEDPPGATSPPAGDGFVAGGAGRLAVITFQPDGAVQGILPGAGLTAQLQHLSMDGQQVSSVPLAQRDTRRYRLRVSGLALDFDAAGRWGLALWARGVEHAAPHRTGAYGTQPVVASAADPRPPVITKTYDAVQLASVRDSQGLHHAHLDWTAAPGAVAYQVYTCSESTFRAHHAMPEPSPAATLQQRVTQVRDAFAANPDRRPFTRVGTEPIAGLTRQVTLPRGTKELHLYVVLGVSGGNVESEWPAVGDPQLRNRFVAFAAPQAVAPGAPQLEVARDVDTSTTPPTYRARIRARTSPGAQVSKVELFRVRVPAAAAQLDTMGPPAHVVTGTGSGFTVTPTPPGDPSNPAEAGTGQAIGTITGIDPVPGSWKPVLYRAVAWGTDDPARGQYGVRSAPSVVREVVVPPAGPPDLSPPAVVLPFPGSSIARLDFATTAPIADTVLGPHRLVAEVLGVDAAGAATPFPLVGAASTLAELATSAPASPDSGPWRDPTASGSTPMHLLVRRTDETVTLRVRIRVTDPLGRMTERVVEVPPGSNTVAPDLTNVVVTTLPGGWVVASTTTMPDLIDGQDVVLSAVLRPLLGRRLIRRTLRLKDIPLVPPRLPFRPFDPFGDPSDPMPVFATRRRGRSRDIAVCVRGKGTLTVGLRTPDGQTASFTRTLGRSL